jgi:hypothetical protein
MAKKYFKKCFDLVDRDKKGYVEKVLVCVCVFGGGARERASAGARSGAR